MAEIPDETMRQLADNIARLNEVMALHSAALIRTTGDTEDFDKILGRLTGTATQADKIEQQLLQKKIQREQYEESAMIKGTAALTSFGSALLSSTQGLEKYNAAIKGGFDSASDTFLSFGTKAGNAAAIISKGIGFAATQINEYTSRVIKAYQALAPLGLASNITSEEIMKMGREAGFSGDQSQLFTKAIVDSKESLIALGGTTTQAIRNFGVLAKSSDVTRKQLDYIGSSLPEFLNFQTTYLQAQVKSGKVINQTTQGIEQLREASYTVYLNMRRLAETTGVSVDRQTEAMKLVQSQQNLQLYNLAQTSREADLRARANTLAEGEERQRLIAQADEIKIQVQRREDLARFGSSVLGASNAVGLMEVLASDNAEVLTSNSVALNNLLQGYGGLNKFVQDFTAGRIKEEEVQSILTSSIVQTTRNLQGLIGVGEGGTKVFQQFGIGLEEANLASSRYATQANKSTEQAQDEARLRAAAAKQEFDARLAAATSLSGLASNAKDSAMALNAVQQAAERTARTVADEARSKVPPFVAAAAGLLGVIAGTVGLLYMARQYFRGGMVPGGRIAVPGDFGLPGTGGVVPGRPTGRVPVPDNIGMPGGTTGAGALGALGKMGRMLPFIGSALSAVDLVSNLSKGNLGAAGLDALGIGLGFVPGGGLLKAGLQGAALGGAQVLADSAEKDRQEKSLDSQQEVTALLKDQQDAQATAATQAFINDTQSINYYDKIYKELIDQTVELKKLNSYGALQTGLMTGSIKPATPGMSTGPTGTMFTGADQQSYFRIPFGERYGNMIGGGGKILENQPTTAGGPVVAANQSQLTEATPATPPETAPTATAPTTSAPAAAPTAPAATAAPAGPRTGGITRPPLDTKEVESNLIPIRSKSGATASVHKNYAQSFQGLINWLDSQNYNISSLGGYNNRNIAGTNIKSIHAYGGAIDINPTLNTGGNSDFPMGIGEVAKNLGLGWGINFTKKDAMHFSVAGSEGGSIPGLAYGGRVTGPTVAMIGEGRTDELVQPLLDNSILDKLAKTPATDFDTGGAEYTVKIENTMKDMISSINYLGEKLSNMQAETNMKIDTSNSYLRDFLKLRRA